MKVGVIFDLDGTLLDTLEDLASATNYALAQFGLPQRSVDYVRSVIGNGALRQIIRSMPDGCTIDPQEILAVYKAHYGENCNKKTQPYPGVPEAVAELAKHFPVGVVTNKPHAPASRLCAAHFPGMYTLGEQSGTPRKPNPDMLRQAMDALGVDRCVYVGDSEVDIRTAENSGVPCLSVLWGLRSRQELLEAGATHLCETAEELVPMLLTMAKQLNA